MFVSGILLNMCYFMVFYNDALRWIQVLDNSVVLCVAVLVLFVSESTFL